MLKTINGKLQLAKKRRECMLMERKVKRINDRIDYCKKHAAHRREVLLKNINLYELYEEERRKNIEV